MHIDALYTIYQEVASKGGVVEVSSIGGFGPLMRNCLVSIDPEHVYESFTQNFVEKIRQLLFTVEFISRNSQAELKLY